MSPDLFGDRVLSWAGPVPLTQTMLTSLATSLVLVAVGFWLARAALRTPSGLPAAAARLLVRFLDALVNQAAGQSLPGLEAFAGTLFCYIAACALVGQLPGVSSPMANLSATSALATLVFLAVPITGVRSRGLVGYLKHYLRPNPLLFPLHVISELSRTIALALRLFGNMMSGHLVVGLIVALVGFFVPVPLMALDLLIGFLQAYIFTILACVYVGAAARIGGEE